MIDDMHEQVQLEGIFCDELIVPIIQFLWDRGLPTFSSCQDEENDHMMKWFVMLDEDVEWKHIQPFRSVLTSLGDLIVEEDSFTLRGHECRHITFGDVRYICQECKYRPASVQTKSSILCSWCYTIEWVTEANG